MYFLYLPVILIVLLKNTSLLLLVSKYAHIFSDVTTFYFVIPTKVTLSISINVLNWNMWLCCPLLEKSHIY